MVKQTLPNQKNDGVSGSEREGGETLHPSRKLIESSKGKLGRTQEGIAPKIQEIPEVSQIF